LLKACSIHSEFDTGPRNAGTCIKRAPSLSGLPTVTVGKILRNTLDGVVIEYLSDISLPSIQESGLANRIAVRVNINSASNHQKGVIQLICEPDLIYMVQ